MKINAISAKGLNLIKPNKFYVYFHINPSNGKVFYIGKGCGKRAYESRSRNIFWHNTVNKYGLEILIVSDNLLNSEASILEKKLIAFYGMDNLCNMTAGGDGCISLKKESREKISNSLKGKIQSEETKIKRSISSKKTWQNPELRELKRIQTNELIKLGLIGKKGNPSKNKGKPFTGDKEKISSSLKKYYENAQVWNKIIPSKHEIDFIINSFKNKKTVFRISKELKKSRSFINRILSENGYIAKRS